MKAASQEVQLVRRLAAGWRLRVEGEGLHLVDGAGKTGPAVDGAIFRRLRATGALAEAADGSWTLSEAGRSLARRLAAAGDVAAQHQTRGHRRLGEGRDSRIVAVDLGESPLAWLRARKGRDGEPMIDDAAFEAGERLRSDFTRGQMMPSITANWSLAAIGARPDGGSRGKAELGDAALAARLRVERALTALGPELAGTVLDFCCFLKGIETIERERNWPKRSARLVLQLGLSALARHYGFAGEAVGAAHHRIYAMRPRSDVA